PSFHTNTLIRPIEESLRAAPERFSIPIHTLVGAGSRLGERLHAMSLKYKDMYASPKAYADFYVEILRDAEIPNESRPQMIEQIGHTLGELRTQLEWFMRDKDSETFEHDFVEACSRFNLNPETVKSEYEIFKNKGEGGASVPAETPHPIAPSVTAESV